MNPLFTNSEIANIEKKRSQVFYCILRIKVNRMFILTKIESFIRPFTTQSYSNEKSLPSYDERKKLQKTNGASLSAPKNAKW